MVESRRFKIAIIALSIVLVLGAILWNTFRNRMPLTYVTIQVTQLDSESYQTSLKPALRRVKGVRKISPDFDSKAVTITFRPDLTSRYDLADVIDDTGHQAILPAAKGSLDLVDYKMFMR